MSGADTGMKPPGEEVNGNEHLNRAASCGPTPNSGVVPRGEACLHHLRIRRESVVVRMSCAPIRQAMKRHQ